jgi:hypothetical protein
MPYDKKMALNAQDVFYAETSNIVRKPSSPDPVSPSSSVSSSPPDSHRRLLYRYAEMYGESEKLPFYDPVGVYDDDSTGDIPGEPKDPTYPDSSIIDGDAVLPQTDDGLGFHGRGGEMTRGRTGRIGFRGNDADGTVDPSSFPFGAMDVDTVAGQNAGSRSIANGYNFPFTFQEKGKWKLAENRGGWEHRMDVGPEMWGPVNGYASVSPIWVQFCVSFLL